MSELVTLTAINHRDGTFHVHTAQCRDIAKDSQKANGVFDLTVFSKTEAVTELWSDFIGEWDGDLSLGEDNTQFFPCVTLPEEAPVEEKASSPEHSTTDQDRYAAMTVVQLRREAAEHSIRGRSSMNKLQLRTALMAVITENSETATPVVELEQPKDIFAPFDKKTPEILKTPQERQYDAAVKGSNAFQAPVTVVAEGQFKKIIFNITSRTVRIGTRVLAHNVATTDQAYAVLRQECGFNSLDFWTFATTFDQVAGILTTNVKVA